MCRQNHLRGCLCLGFGLGLGIGYSLDSWILCACGGIALIFLGIMTMRQ